MIGDVRCRRVNVCTPKSTKICTVCETDARFRTNSELANARPRQLRRLATLLLCVVGETKMRTNRFRDMACLARYRSKVRRTLVSVCSKLQTALSTSSSSWDAPLLNDFASERLQRGQEGAQTGQGCPQTLYLQVVELAVLPRGRKLGCHRPSRVRSRLFAY